VSNSTSLAPKPQADPGPTVTIVVPALNEERGLRQILPSLVERAASLEWQVVVVDDGSSDSTADVARSFGVDVISHGRTRGYGAALKTGIGAAKGPWIATMDADGQHTLEALEAVLAPRESADMVVGARRGLRQSRLWRMPGKWALGKLAAFIANRPVPDLNSGLRVCRAEIARRYIHLCPDGFSFSTTVSLAFHHRGHDVVYVPISIQSSTSRSTVTPISGLGTLLLILRLATLFEPLRLFVAASLIFITAGLLYAVPYALAGRGISIGAALVMLTGVQLLFVGLIADQISSLRKERYE
jgi:glycosyltransferase involved in cell wall biosynthesis